jgi:hypothetical protein
MRSFTKMADAAFFVVGQCQVAPLVLWCDELGMDSSEAGLWLLAILVAPSAGDGLEANSAITPVFAQ